MEPEVNVNAVFKLLDLLQKAMDVEGANDSRAYVLMEASLLAEIIQKSGVLSIVNEQIITNDPRYCNHNQRVTHFILYINSELPNCDWIKHDSKLNLDRYIHGKPITSALYFKLVELLNLTPFISEVIMFTPYAFCRDLIAMILDNIKHEDAYSQLVYSENLIIALLNCIKRVPPNSTLEEPFMKHFNEGMIVFNKNYLPNDVRRSDDDDDDEEQKDVTKYNGFRVKAIFKILVEVIKFNNFTATTNNQYPVYTFNYPLHGTTPVGDALFKKCFDVIMYKCMNMCDFSVHTWLSWYEIEVVEDETNLQSSIGHLCFELCGLIDCEIVNESLLKEFKPILRNISIEKVDFSKFDLSNIDSMVDNIKNCSKIHINDWIKKLMENSDVFTHSDAIEVLHSSMDKIDYNCFKRIIDHSVEYQRTGGFINESFCIVLYKGIEHMDLEDKFKILKYIIIEYPEANFEFRDFDNELAHIAHNEYSNSVNRDLLMSKLIWLVALQPRKMFHLLISQYITGICGLPPKKVESKRSILHQIMVFAHVNMHGYYIYKEYRDWLSFELELPEEYKTNLRLWIFGASRLLRLMKPKIFLANVISPILHPSPNYPYMLYLINITKFFLSECPMMMSLPDLGLWQKLIIQLAKILDDARWNINNFSSVRAELCEMVIVTIQPLLVSPSYLSLDEVKQELLQMSLMTRNHFLRLWTAEFITVEGMDEHFIMTIQSQSHISYSNLNILSTQKVQEEFIFSIATYMPKFTLYEMKSFLANYLSSAKIHNIFEASFFVLDCVMNALMRIIVYLKTAIQNDPYGDECAWNYLDNTIINFLDAVNTSKMCSIYDEEVNPSLAFNSITKIIMVLKQMHNSRQMPLLVVVRRLIDLIIPSMDKQSTTKLLTLIASIKSPASKSLLQHSVNSLMAKLESEQTPQIPNSY